MKGAARAAILRPMSLTADQVAAFQRDGYLPRLAVMAPAEAERYRALVEDYLAPDPAGRLPDLRTKAYITLRPLEALVRWPAILDAVESLLGPDLLCRGASLFYKPAGSPDYVSWHQDALYWGLEPAEVVTAWLALTPSTAENGALEVLPGSHIGALLPHAAADSGGNLLRRAQTIAVPIDPAQVRRLELRPGEVSLHHVKIAHGSGPNRSGRARLGLAIRYMPTRVRNVTGEARHALLVRGEDRYHHFLPEPASWSYPRR